MRIFKEAAPVLAVGLIGGAIIGKFVIHGSYIDILLSCGLVAFLALIPVAIVADLYHQAGLD